jgi:hypothetical protein
VELQGTVADDVQLGDDTRRRHINAASWERLTRALGARVLSAAERMHDVHGHR